MISTPISTNVNIQPQPQNLETPQVQFVGEEGVDEGGVQKEFFQLLVSHDDDG
jgi:hypothetical protein